MFTVATAVFDAGSIRAIFFEVEQLVIHTALTPTAMPPQGVVPSDERMFASTRPVSGLNRTTEPLFGTPAQSLPSPVASQLGPLFPDRPTPIAVRTSFVTWSTGITLPPRTSATQTPSGVPRTPFGEPPTGI